MVYSHRRGILWLDALEFLFFFLHLSCIVVLIHNMVCLLWVVVNASRKHVVVPLDSYTRHLELSVSAKIPFFFFFFLCLHAHLHT
ncbi:hypothetical protein QBC32DRAFT_98941 [Pseudoneurospora amorphoporcata]|uniref:Uncharacterized protein n=1 Tax=Pseudoneurospora amorphoporcata TaxID=241081 RepID=A0AAN6NXU5_9PEZI|nr:hypothetical protein QBC32DRAFT_98941 [Pseudoneurospora amorphoporcata]